MTEDNWRNRSERMRCFTCVFYVSKLIRDGREVGRCRRNAPTMKGFPVVFPGDWCGEHRLDEASYIAMKTDADKA